jgi:dTDP-4-dehydrorhamnose reductase
MRYALIGSAGQLGRELRTRLDGEVIALTREQTDLSRPQTVRDALAGLRPDVVVNCAAYNFVDRAESEPEAAFAVNAWGVRALAEFCRAQDVLLVHFSTDYVFGLDAGRKTPYAETDAPGPLGVYGLSKLAGEYLGRAIAPHHLIIRTCGLYGRPGAGGKGTNFVETMLRLAAQGKALRVISDQVCTPSAATDVAATTVELLRGGRTGLFHVVNAGSCSWFEFARAIFELSGLKVNLTPITAAEYGSPARRPGYSVLSSATVPPLRPWREALASYLEERRTGAG